MQILGHVFVLRRKLSRIVHSSTDYLFVRRIEFTFMLMSNLPGTAACSEHAIKNKDYLHQPFEHYGIQ